MRRTALLLSTAFAFSFALTACEKDEPEPGPSGDTGGEDDGEEEESDEDGEETDDAGDTTGGAESDSEDEAEGSGSSGGEAVDCDYDEPPIDTLDPGQMMPHFELVDFRGEPFNYCDHFGSPVVLDVSAVWCGPCNNLAGCLAGDEARCEAYVPDQWWRENYLYPMRDYINAGCLTFFTVLTQGQSGAPATDADAEQWDLQYPNENIALIADNSLDPLVAHYPFYVTVNNDGTILSNDLQEGIELVINNLDCPEVDGN